MIEISDRRLIGRESVKGLSLRSGKECQWDMFLLYTLLFSLTDCCYCYLLQKSGLLKKQLLFLNPQDFVCSFPISLKLKKQVQPCASILNNFYPFPFFSVMSVPLRWKCLTSLHFWMIIHLISVIGFNLMYFILVMMWFSWNSQVGCLSNEFVNFNVAVHVNFWVC